MPNDLSSPSSLLDVPPATTAVLHGMMSTLSEVLGGIDGRIASLEHQLREARAEVGSPRALAQTVEASVARLAERIEALEAVVTSIPPPPEPPPPPGPDQELHAAVDALRQSVDALAVRPMRDDDLHRAVAQLAEAVASIPPPPEPVPFPEIPPPPPPPEPDPRIGEILALVAAIPPPPEPPGPDENVRLGITSLHERLAVLLELAAQPPKPDDAVRLSLVDLQAEVAALREKLAEPPPPPEPQEPDPAHEELAASLRLVLTRLGDVATTVENLPPPPEIPPPPPPPEPDPRIGEILALLADHPATSLHDALQRVEGQVADLVAQPGPGPAMAMVAAGLSERFEARTDALVELLTSAIRRLEEPAALAGRIDRLGDTITTQNADVARAVQQGIDHAVVRLVADMQAIVAAIPPPPEPAPPDTSATDRMADQFAALSGAIDRMRATLDALVEESSNSIGRKATEVGRKLAADLGIRGRKGS